MNDQTTESLSSRPEPEAPQRARTLGPPGRAVEARSGFVLLVLTLGSLMALGPLSIDMYLPAFPQIAGDYGVTVSSVQLSLTAYFVGLAAGQLLYGPVADRFGRKLPLFIGLAIYAVASFLCSLAPTVEAFTGLRFLQAVGSCSGMVVARAMVRDLFDQRASARVFSLLMLVMGIAPILAPMLGGLVSTVWGWKTIFVSLGLFASFCLAAVALFLPETRRPDPEVRISRVFPTYLGILTDRRFASYALAGGVAQAGMFAYITGSPFVFISLFGVPAEHYGWIFALNASGLIVTSQLNVRLLNSRSVESVLKGAAGVLVAASGCLVVASFFHFGFWAFSVPLFVFVATLGMIFPNTVAAALANQGSQAGSASALLGTLQFSCAALASVFVSFLHDDTSRPMAMIMATCGSIAFFLLVFVALPKRAARAGHDV